MACFKISCTTFRQDFNRDVRHSRATTRRFFLFCDTQRLFVALVVSILSFLQEFELGVVS